MGSNIPRPVFLDLRRIRLPVTGLVSILHRISGVVLFLSIPFVVFLLDLSLRGPQSFTRAGELLDKGYVKLWMFVALWALLHHLAAGIRVLLIDVDVGVGIEQARKSARYAMVGAPVAALIVGVILL